MKRKPVFFIIFFILAISSIVWGAQKTITTYTWDANIHVQPKTYTISFADNIADFTATPSTAGAVSVDTVNNTATLGNGVGNSCGVLWYGGTNNLVAQCSGGKCDFGCGFRAYFEFEDTYTGTHGDGFTFTVMNGANNDKTKRGGPSTCGSAGGELMCYAGEGNTTDGLGLQPPKMAIEFDKYANTGISANACDGGRNDTNNNHMALIFWGDNPGSNCCTGVPNISYDNNIHGAGTWGSAAVPRNSATADSTADGSRGYYEAGSSTWLNTNAKHPFRIEVTRASTTNTNGNYEYNVKAWIDCTGCNNVKAAYSASTPQIDRTIELTPALHTNFNKMIFGFTEGTGGALQNILISNFIISFPCSVPCIVVINPTSRLHTAGASTGNTVALTVNTGCVWTAVSNDAWITVTGGASGTGNGTVTYSVGANTGTVRTGTITIGDQTFTVTQASGCAYSISPASRSHSYTAAAGQTVGVTAGAGCSWTAVSNDAWITVTGGASGTGSDTVTYSITANSGAARTGTITIAGQTFTVNQAEAPPTCTLTANPSIVPYNNTTVLTWTINNGPANGTWTGAPGGTCGAFSNSTGGSCTTSARTTPGANTFTLNVSNAEGSSTCSTTIYVGCQNYRVWNRLGGTRDFRVNGVCRQVNNNSEITQAANRLNPGATIIAYASAGTCATPLGIVLDYNDAMNVDIAINGGDADCRVNFTGNHNATDR
ncbi:MAG: hypothetical protein CVU51_01440 [Deltaproteobacteria bacterium HGW-Deltaproteobacteria-1]|jgi:hypothetical protein|nr:MAG: hypothetical protein CVU51_01440 [Deltaproteobacteria bacterium HGW-Deltaproteobacteria-1]